jgi:small-conductance mechanosensitive channel
MLIFLWIWIVVVVSAVLIDGWRRAEVQRYFAWCASAAIALLYLAYYIGKSETWLRLSAQWVS